MTSPHDRTRAMVRLERTFENNAEAHMLLAMIDTALRLDHVEVWSPTFYARLHACVCEHIRLSGDVYDRR
jgi:hypothetical protein